MATKTPKAPRPKAAPPAPTAPAKPAQLELTVAQIIAHHKIEDPWPPLLNAFAKLKTQAYPGAIAYRVQRVWREIHQAFADYEEIRATTIQRLGEPHPDYQFWIPDHNLPALKELEVVLRDYGRNVIPLSITGRLPFPARGEFTGVEIELLDTYGLIEPPAGM